MSNDEQAIAAWLQIVKALGDTVRDLGRVPSGELYAVAMASLNYEQYTRAIETLKRAGLVSETNHELIWIGPKEEQR
jgi:hypothetical protein